MHIKIADLHRIRGSDGLQFVSNFCVTGFILATLQDKSWRVRYNVAAQMVPLCESLGPDMTRAELVPAYVKLLEDTEVEVRIAAAGKVAAFSKMLTPALIVSQVVPRVKELANDSSQFVRAALAGECCSSQQMTSKHL